MATASGSADGADTGEALARLARLAQNLGPSLLSEPTQRALDGLARATRLAFAAAAASVALLDEAANELVYVASSDRSGTGVTGLRVAPTTGLAGWVVATGQPVSVDEATADPRFARDVAERTGYVPDALLVVPIRGRRGVIGVLSILDRDTERPGADEDLVLSGLLADQVAVSVEADLHVAAMIRLILTALADQSDDEDTAAALRRHAEQLEAPDDVLARLAATFADLQDRSPALADIAVEILGVFTFHARRAGWVGG